MRSEYWAPYEAMLLCARAIVSDRYCFTKARVARTELSITCAVSQHIISAVLAEFQSICTLFCEQVVAVWQV